MNVCGIGHLLRVVSFLLGLFLLLLSSNVDAQPGSPTNLLRLEDFAAACSKDILDAGTDSMCRQAISMALGKEPIVEEVRNPDGTVVRTTRHAQPDRGQAGWLGEEACEHGQWQSCMLYVMLLERGDGVPLDRERAETLMHHACAKGHRLACQSLHQKGITPAPAGVLPPRPAWVSQAQPEQQRDAANATAVEDLLRAVREQEQKQQQDLSPDQKLLLQQKQVEEERRAALAAEPVSNAAAAEAALIAKCMAASKEACYAVAQGYDVGKGMPRDPARAAFYYEKACDAGHAAACAQRGKIPGAPAAQSPSASTGMLAGIAMALLIGVAFVVLRRRGAAADGGGERPAPVRPAAAPRSPR